MIVPVAGPYVVKYFAPLKSLVGEAGPVVVHRIVL